MEERRPMPVSITRRLPAGLVACAAILPAAFAAAIPADASALYACVAKKGGAVRLVTKSQKCRKSEHRVSWETQGPAGANGTNGSNGQQGEPGQPQKAFTFSASLTATDIPAAVFNAAGVSYTATCDNLFGARFTFFDATAPSGEAYGQASFGRPSGQELVTEELTGATETATLGGGEQTVAFGATAGENKAKSKESYAVWTVTVEQPSSVTWLHIWIDTNTGCTLRGSGVTLPT
jgi:hypothetical protein